MGRQPYKDMTVEEIESSVLRGCRASVPDWCNSRWKELMEECWAQNEHVRPSFEEIYRRLHQMVLVQQVLDINYYQCKCRFFSSTIPHKTFYCGVCKESEEAREEIVNRMIGFSLPQICPIFLVGRSRVADQGRQENDKIC